jgi:phosphotransferase system enzyme I (PtsI)
VARLVLFGIPVSPGIAIGKVSRMQRSALRVARMSIAADAVEAEVSRLYEAAQKVREELARAQDSVPADLPEQREIIASHMLICQDPKLLQGAVGHIEQGMSAIWALEKTGESLCAAFCAIGDPYLRDRVQDIRTVIGRMQSCLYGYKHIASAQEAPAVLLAEEISPADAIELKLDRILSLVTVEGGQTTHMAILARSLHMPAVVGVSGLLQVSREGELVIVDALKGCVCLEPDEAELTDYARRQEDYSRWQEQVRRSAHLPAETLDAVRIEVRANIEEAKECEAVLESGAQGIGLCRTEFAYLKSRSLPTENALYEEYRTIAKSQAPARVIFRTLDLGADKMSAQHRALGEVNPALGLRAIRYCLRHQDVFRTQLRAILRAGACGNVAVMLPMITGLQEVDASRRIINEAARELRAEGMPCDPHIPVGVMIEVPSAVMIADALAGEADFFSIGTNDLLHYLLAIDRRNTHVAYLHEPLHPAVMRAVKHVIDCAHREGIGVSICGELAADPYCLPVFLGMGVDVLSASPQFVPIVKHLVRKLRKEDCIELARSVLMTTDVAAANRMVTEALCELLHEEADFHTTMVRTA